MADSDASPSGQASPKAVKYVDDLVDRVCDESFTEWFQERQFTQNILDGKSYFNGPSPPKPPTRHAPSELLQCHRKQYYSRYNAPKEDESPEGLYWIGSAFEEEIVVPYLQDTIPENTYVQNSIWIDTTITTATGVDLSIRGATDPAIVTADADPLLVTEVKTTSNTEHLTEPKRHHRAQLTAYLYGLNQEYDHTIDTGVVIYGDRETFTLATFPVTFDDEFWESKVVPWLATQTEHHQHQSLPPASPEFDWECSYCSYRHRCGKAETPYADIGAKGLLPLYDQYDRQYLTEYLDAPPDARLTPIVGVPVCSVSVSSSV